ncbi:MAG: Gfo/Idh/MocA family oxidoreductase [Lachnospiraceae bacterium]|jgi:hypothetical protein|nr:Gfo/Idh/MocA family oxidoreductase [Lachnospiraceae bacterium]
MKIGIICPSEIALRRFMPALQQCDEFEFAGLGIFTIEERFGGENIDSETFEIIRQQEIDKAQVFINQYGGKIYDGYGTIATSPDIEALYVPLPPALHYKWAKLALESGKHVLVEKPSTVSYSDSAELIRIAKENNLALHENYMFTFHKQLDAIEDIIRSGEIGDVRLYRICFGFPMRAANDFRYNRALGGGALIDAGGYTIRYATRLLGSTAKIVQAQSNYLDGFDVDMYGSAVMVNDEGATAQISFGMDNNYKCELEVWGSKGCLTTGRVLTAPAGFIPTATIRIGNEERIVELPVDDAFLKSIQHFADCIKNEKVRKDRYNIITKQAELVDEFKRLALWQNE